MAAWDDRRTWRARDAADRRSGALDTVAEAARTLLALRTGRGA